MKQVLIISASPRKNGNSEILCDRFANGALESGCKVEKVLKENLERTMEAFRGFTEDCLDGAREAGIIYGTGAWQAGEIKSTDAYDEAYEMGKSMGTLWRGERRFI